jgi:hypothetical protein
MAVKIGPDRANYSSVLDLLLVSLRSRGPMFTIGGSLSETRNRTHCRQIQTQFYSDYNMQDCGSQQMCLPSRLSETCGWRLRMRCLMLGARDKRGPTPLAESASRGSLVKMATEAYYWMEIEKDLAIIKVLVLCNYRRRADMYSS